MGIGQFSNTLSKIYRAEHVGLATGLLRHMRWQYRKARGAFPVQLSLSRSTIQADEPLGIAALVNCLGMYDYNNMNLVQRAMDELDAALLDIGANIGAYSLVASETGNRVIAVEAHPTAFQMLQNNIRSNGRDNVTLVQTAVSDRGGELLFSDQPSLEINQVVTADDDCPTIKVRCQTADELCRQLDCWPSVVKMDVEGHEPAVIRGFSDGLSRADLLVIEDGQRAEIRELLKSYDLEGPLYYHHQQRMFSKQPQSLPEDPVYVRPAARSRLQRG